MKYFFQSVRPILLDFLSTIAFLIALSFLHDVRAAILIGIAVGVAEIAWEVVRHRKISIMQAASLFLVVTLGGASLILHDPRFVMVKPSVGYTAIGIVMLKRGWQAGYVPPIALELVPERRFIVWGYVWAGLMLFSAVGNLVLVALVDLKTWALILTVWGLGSKIILFGAEYGSIRLEAGRAYRRRAAERASPENPVNA